MDQDIPSFGEDASRPTIIPTDETGPPEPPQFDSRAEPPQEDTASDPSTPPPGLDQMSEWVREHPLAAVAAALGLGVAVGVILARLAR